MAVFLIPLLLGFALNGASAFTAAYSRRWGERAGQWVSLLLRNVVGVPLWVIGLGLAVRTPSPTLLTTTPMTGAWGWLMITAGCLIILLALVSLRAPAFMPSTQDTLVRRGLYAHVRHPIYGGVLLEFTGIAMLIPTQAVMVACTLGIGWVFIQARLEELDLLQRMPTYREYMQHVPRFIPRPSRNRPT